MNPTSHRALLDLMSYGTEELSSSDADKLMQLVSQCPECKGEWVLVERTITTLSQTGELPVAESQSHQMWLVCLGHAQSHKHHGENGDGHHKHDA